MDLTPHVYDEQPWSDDHEATIETGIKRRRRTRSILTSVGIMVAAGLVGFSGAMLVDNVVSADTSNSSTSTTSDSTTSLSDALSTSMLP